MKRNNKTHRCSYCDKPLQIETCPECDGNGEIRHFLFWKQTCPNCKGSGKRYYCPDQQKHDAEKFKKALKKPIKPDSHIRTFKEVSPSSIKGLKFDTKSNKCPLCGGKGWVYDFNTRQTKPCPRCNLYKQPPTTPPITPPPGDYDGDGRADYLERNPFGPFGPK